MNCTICTKPIVLRPSAEERTKKFGETPGFYTRIFREHADCQIAKRNADTLALMRRINNKE